MTPVRFDRLPDAFQKEAVRPYAEYLTTKKWALFWKRCFDLIASFLLIILLSPIMLVLAVLVKATSTGPVLFKQERVTALGKRFLIWKFRSMVDSAEGQGPLVTVNEDHRITSIGRFLRKSHLDELPQLFNVLTGDMSFVGTRPEVPKYVGHYTDEMMATLLLPAGITSMTSISFSDESQMLVGEESMDSIYIHKILPMKMEMNLEYVRSFSLKNDCKILINTVLLFLGIYDG